MKKYLPIILTISLLTVISNGCSDTQPDSTVPKETVIWLDQGTTDSALPETQESSTAGNEISDTVDDNNAASYYGTWEVRDYQGAEVSMLSAEDMESFRGATITYQSDSVSLNNEIVTEGTIAYETGDTAYDYDLLTETYNANLGEWWNNIGEVTCVTVASDNSFFGNQFFVANSDTIWIYYEGVFFLASKKL